MFVEWWMIFVVLVLIGIWAEYREQCGRRAAGRELQQVYADEATLFIIEELVRRRGGIPLSLATIAVIRALQRHGIIVVDDDLTVRGQQRQINFVDIDFRFLDQDWTKTEG